MSPVFPVSSARRVIAAFVALIVSGPMFGAPTRAGADVPPYRPPVSRRVLAPFDLPNGPYGRGNRGLDYAVVADDPIVSIGDGSVVFAGSVAGERFVTVLHPDGLRSSYSYLSRIDVARGHSVVSGQQIGLSSQRFQLGVRRGDTYIDPAPLLSVRPAPRPRHARLVAGPPPRRPHRPVAGSSPPTRTDWAALGSRHYSADPVATPGAPHLRQIAGGASAPLRPERITSVAFGRAARVVNRREAVSP